MPRRISSASRTPSVVSSALFAPVCVSVAFVVTVVPCTIVSIVGAKASSVIGGCMLAAMSTRPSTTAIDGSAGVDSVLKIAGSAPSRVTTKSVKVPPTSIPILSVMLRVLLDDWGSAGGLRLSGSRLRGGCTGFGRLRGETPDLFLAHLAERGLRQRVDEDDVLRMLEAGDAVLQQREHAVGVDRAARAPDDDGDHHLAPVIVGAAHDRGFLDVGRLDQHVLDLGRIDVLAARDDHVLLAAVDPEEAVGVEVPDVAGVEPAVDEHGVGG